MKINFNATWDDSITNYEKFACRMAWTGGKHTSLCNTVDLLFALANMEQGQEFIAADLPVPHQCLTEMLRRGSCDHYSNGQWITEYISPVEIVRDENIKIKIKFFDYKKADYVEMEKETTRHIYKMVWPQKIMLDIANAVAEKVRIVY